MFDRLREFVNEKLGREDPGPPVQTTVDHGYVRDMDLDTPAAPGRVRYIDGGTIPEGAVLKNRFGAGSSLPVPNPVARILWYADLIRNDRTAASILRHARDDEMIELEDEVEAWNSLPEHLKNTDRVIAEAMDVVGCMVDLIHHVKPDITLSEIDRITETFCIRWQSKYSRSAGKPEGTDARARRSL